MYDVFHGIVTASVPVAQVLLSVPVCVCETVDTHTRRRHMATTIGPEN